ncbi:MAG: hypothetical protein JHD07_11135 [Bradyrhizobium sp.]|jgi:hypothetical protein|uniref:hypothetical protein n=1 Tax=Bradyrhizobium TaxID=374 RepID=UPI0004255035|nr:MULTISPECIES: hypothetical protein [Bradyrhizobium]MBJ7403808.1 hypothetical protein [Bradyrhizobium sp.]
MQPDDFPDPSGTENQARAERHGHFASIDIKTVTADAGYVYAKIFGAIERRGIDALSMAFENRVNLATSCARRDWAGSYFLADGGRRCFPTTGW